MSPQLWTVPQWVAYLGGCFVIGAAVGAVRPGLTFWQRGIVAVAAAMIWRTILQLGG